MKDVHGERIRVVDLMNWLANHAEMHEELLIMVGEDGPNGEPGEAALMVWREGRGPGETAVNVPVFTKMPAFYTGPDAPRVDYPAEPDWIGRTG
jgi:hypothetical protein